MAISENSLLSCLDDPRADLSSRTVDIGLTKTLKESSHSSLIFAFPADFYPLFRKAEIRFRRSTAATTTTTNSAESVSGGGKQIEIAANSEAEDGLLLDCKSRRCLSRLTNCLEKLFLRGLQTTTFWILPLRKSRSSWSCILLDFKAKKMSWIYADMNHSERRRIMRRVKRLAEAAEDTKKAMENINPDEIPEKVHIQVCLEGEWKEEELSDLSKVEERSDDDECDDVNSGIRIINQVRHWITAYIDKNCASTFEKPETKETLKRYIIQEGLTL